MSREHASGYMRSPCKGHEMGCLQLLLLKASTEGEKRYENHRCAKCHFKLISKVNHHGNRWLADWHQTLAIVIHYMWYLINVYQTDFKRLALFEPTSVVEDTHAMID